MPLGFSAEALAEMKAADRLVPTLFAIGCNGTQLSLGASSPRQSSGWSPSVRAGPDFCAS